MSEEKAVEGGGEPRAAGDAEREATQEPEPEKDGPLQFDKAEFDEAPAAPTCASCSRPVESSYFQIGDKIVCASCKEEVLRAIASAKAGGSFFRAGFYGAGAALLGAVIWYAIREATGYEIGLVAIGIGLLVGVAVKRGAAGFGGRRYQVLGVVLTYVSVCLANVPIIVKALGDRPAPTAEQPGGPAGEPTPGSPGQEEPASPAPDDPAAEPSTPAGAEGGFTVVGLLVAFVIVFGLALASPFLAGVENIIGILIIGIALYEAWKINRYVAPSIQGPFEVMRARDRAADEASTGSG